MGYALANNLVAKHNRTVDSSLFFASLSLVLIIFSRKVIATDTLTQSEGISFRQTLVSSSQVFELGFFSPGKSTKKYIGILNKNIASHKIVWVANRENPLKASDTTARFFIGKDGNLKLVDSMRKTVWSTNVSSQIHNTTVVLSDKGNLILKDNVTGYALWESFNYPGDTSIPGITLGPKQMTGNHTLSSWITEDDPSPGIFLCELTAETPPQIVVRTSSKPYWRSGPWDGSKFIGQHNPGVGYAYGVTVMQNSQHGYTYVVYSPPSSSHVAIFQLTVNGNLIRSDWDVLTGKGGFKWQSIDVLCDVYGTCGPNGFCNRKRSNSCECLKGFVAKSTKEWAKGNWTSGCVRRTELLCGKNTSNAPRIEKEDGFLKFSTMKLPNNYKYYFLLDSSGCRNFCLSNCTCVAYAYPDGIGCLIWYGDLVDTQQFSSGGADLFLRLSYSDIGEKRKSMKIIISLSGTLGVFLFCAFLYGLYRWKAKHRGGKVKKRLQRKETDSDTTLLLGSQTDSSDLPMFQFKTLKVATSNFSETNKLGGGGFGPVYKGILEDGKVVAVKRLSSFSGQGAEEFENEILMICKLQHRNLVKLLGYCIKKDEKLIIYEYMKNKSLDTYLFDTKSAEQLDWAKRLNIIHGIARGLLYLHRDSRLRIIHRDLKASNILLDENMNPKISDFGLARSFQITQEQANTNHVVGTFGYISPEYAMGGLVSEKSDVYSFGVLLLEIISGMRITSIYDDGKYNLLCYAWNLWEEGKATDLIDRTLTNACPDADFIRCMHIGLLCVQDHTADRPTMSTIVLMLTGDTDLPQPKQPVFYRTMVRYGLNSQSSPKFYVEVDNNVDDKVEADTLLTLNGDAHVHNEQYPTHRHTGSQRGEGKDINMTPDLELKMKSI